MEAAKIQLILMNERFPSDQKIKEITEQAIKKYGACELDIQHCVITPGQRRVTLKCKSDNDEVLPLAILEYCVYLLGNVRILHRVVEYKRG